MRCHLWKWSLALCALEPPPSPLWSHIGNRHKASTNRSTTTAYWRSTRTSRLSNFLDRWGFDAPFFLLSLLRSPRDHYHVEPHLANRPSWRWGRVPRTGRALLLLLPSSAVHPPLENHLEIVLISPLTCISCPWSPAGTTVVGVPWLSCKYSLRNPFLTNSSNWYPNAKQLRRLWPKAWWNSHQVSLLSPDILSVFGGDFNLSTTLRIAISS